MQVIDLMSEVLEELVKGEIMQMRDSWEFISRCRPLLLLHLVLKIATLLLLLHLVLNIATLLLHLVLRSAAAVRD